MRNPLISIITPTWNVANTVERALLSVVNQRYTEIEHIFIDNSSNDETVSIISDYRKKYKHIRLLTEKDEGIYDAMNKGLDLCTGDWIYFLGADDELYDEYVLETLFEQGLFQEEQVVYGNVVIRGDASWVKDGAIYDGPFDLGKLFRKNICHQSMFFPRSVIKQVGYFSKKYHITSDWDYNVRCSAQYKFTYIDKIIAFFQGGGKSSEGGVLFFYQDLPETVIKYFKLDPNDNNLFNPDSPFYYPVSRYRIEKYLRIIEEQKNEKETFLNQLQMQESDHFQNIATLKAQHDESVLKINTENDNILQNLKSDHQTATLQMMAENENFIQTLKSDHQTATLQMMAENENFIQTLKSDHQTSTLQMMAENENFIQNLKSEHQTATSQLMAENENFIQKLKSDYQTATLQMMAENEKLIQNMESVHLNALNALLTENHRFIQSMNTDHVNEIKKLMVENEDSRMRSKEKYEREIELVQNGLDAAKVLLQMKEDELNKIIEAGKRQVDHLSEIITDNAEEIKNNKKAHEQEISSIRSLISEKEQEISAIRQSYTWKTGRALLFPAQFVLRKVKKKA